MRTQHIFAAVQTLALSTLGSSAVMAQYDEPTHVEDEYIEFHLDRSPGIVQTEGCLPYAAGKVRVTARGPVEVMDVELEGLPPNIELDAFVIQVPNFPFGMSWYQGDIETDGYGKAKAQFIGRFNVETFVIAPGVAPAPVVHHEPTQDAAENPVTAPIHTFHIGIWFNSPDDARAAGCPAAVTPFNGEHNAGVQVFNTASFPDHAGPLSQLK
jgi:hypothetical protein